MGCDVLVIIAHPDDEIFVSGVICACGEKGLVVNIACVTDGEGGLDPDTAPSTETLHTIRRKELLGSAAALGVEEVFFLGYPDLADPTMAGGWDFDALVQDLANRISRQAPRIILSHGPLGGYGHIAHKTVFNSVMRAVEKSGENVAVLSFCGKTPKAFFSWHLDQPSDLIFDVRRFIQVRCDSLSQHYSQLDYFLQPKRPVNTRRFLSALFGYAFSFTEFGRKRVPIITRGDSLRGFHLRGS